MSWIDWILIAFCLLALFSGFRSGLVSRVCNLAGLLGGILFGKLFSPMIAPYLQEKFDLPLEMLPAASRAVVILLFIVAGFVTGFILSRGINKTPLSLVNKLLGGALALLLTLLAASVLFTTIDTVTHTAVASLHPKEKREETPGVRDRSLFYRPVANLFPKVLSLFSSRKHNDTDQPIEELD